MFNKYFDTTTYLLKDEVCEPLYQGGMFTPEQKVHLRRVLSENILLQLTLKFSNFLEENGQIDEIKDEMSNEEKKSILLKIISDKRLEETINSFFENDFIKTIEDIKKELHV